MEAYVSYDDGFAGGVGGGVFVLIISGHLSILTRLFIHVDHIKGSIFRVKMDSSFYYTCGQLFNEKHSPAIGLIKNPL